MATVEPINLEAGRLPSGMILLKFTEGQPPYQKGQTAAFMEETARTFVENGVATVKKPPQPKAAAA